MQTFGKTERLKSKKIIDRLFSEGNNFSMGPYYVTWLPEADGSYPLQVLIAVSKKKIRKAVTRNLLKRRSREAYRKNKESFINFLVKNNKGCTLALVYSSSRITEYQDIQEKIILILKRLQKTYEESIR